VSTAAELVREAADAGLSLDLRPDGTVFVRPKDRITPAIIERLRAAKAELVEYLRRERLADQAAEVLAGDPTLQRAAKAEPIGAGFVVAVAVRTPSGDIATAFLTVPKADGFDLLAALDAACRGPLQ